MVGGVFKYENIFINFKGIEWILFNMFRFSCFFLNEEFFIKILKNIEILK